MLKNYLYNKKEIFEQKLKDVFVQYKYPSRLSEAMKYAVFNGGKRLRPVLMYMMVDLYNQGVFTKIDSHQKIGYNKIEDTAVAMEFIHCYSLVHDDLPAMDNDDYRRGVLTTHKKYDEATAILVGDALLTESFNIISCSNAISNNDKVEIIKILSKYAGFNGMIGGQYLDVESENRNINREDIEYIHNNKTGKLLIASIELPLIILGIPDEKKEQMKKLFEILGLIYQIKDDIIEVEGKFEETGKLQTDIDNNKNTYVTLYGLEKSKQILLNYGNDARNIIYNTFNGHELLIKLVDFFEQRKA